MNNIFIVQNGITDDQFFNARNRDNCSDPYITFRSRLQDLGYNLSVLGDRPLDECAWILFFDAPSVYPPSLPRRVAYRLASGTALGSRNVYKECIAAGLAERMALFLWEGRVVLPDNWDPELHGKFPVVFTWCNRYVDGKRFHEVRWPQPLRFPTVEPRPFGSKKLLVNISMNKASRQPDEIYSARRDAIRYFERVWPQDFDLYGVGWDKRLGIRYGLSGLRHRSYPSYRGTVKDKWELFPRYRFALCYENMQNETGYITEKVFDCMRADCVPIYLGASDVDAYLPPWTFIDRRRFASNSELEDYIVGMSETEYERHRSAIRDFLSGPHFTAFLEEAFVTKIITVLGLKGQQDEHSPHGKAQISSAGVLSREDRV